MNDPKRSPIPSPNSNDPITKLQISLNNVLQCIADTLNLVPENAPAITQDQKVDNEEAFSTVKEDIVRCANDISCWFESANNSISELGHLNSLKGTNGEKFLQKIRRLKERNIKCNIHLKETLDEFRKIYSCFDNEINNYIDSSIKEKKKIDNKLNKMELIFGEMYGSHDS
ncbi:hypothetical protein RS030_7955 [Cryptosporidium xiaoi]|uniref:Uncharacterized protein n=1 Tax=Cryptosporidium xiaoi TaxID=659607 RepID=A0AAV9XVB4_9CRYT